MTTYYKAVRCDGTDFYSGIIQWAPPEGHEGDWIVRHPTSTEIGTDVSSYLSVSTVPTDCSGMEWPCRLFEVEGDVEPDTFIRHKVVGLEFRVVRELDSHIALGPQGEYVAALIDRAACLTGEETGRLSTAWVAAVESAEGAIWDGVWDAARGARDAAWYAVWDAARDAAVAAARGAAGDAAGDAACHAAWDAAGTSAGAAAGGAAVGMLMRDLLSAKHYDTLTRPWRTVIGPIHPDDPDWEVIPDQVIPRYAMLDLWAALQGDVLEFEAWRDSCTYGEAWAQLIAWARTRAPSEMEAGA